MGAPSPSRTRSRTSSGTRATPLSRALGLLALLVLCGTPHVLFSVLDQRNPNDHDEYYTAHLMQTLLDLGAPDGHEGVLMRLADVFIFAEDAMHPPLAQTFLLWTLHTFGASPTTFRMSTLPFLLLLVAGTYWTGRLMLGHRFGLLAGFVVGTMPAIINFSRKWESMFHAAAVSVLALALAVALVRRPAHHNLGFWVALGLCQGIRFYTHPIVLPDIALIFGLLAVFFLIRGRADGLAAHGRWLRGWALSVVLCAGVGAWFLGNPWTEDPSYGLRHYLDHKAWMTGSAGTVIQDFTLVEATVKVLSNLVFSHWMIGYTLLLVVPGAMAAALGLAVPSRGAVDRRVARTATFLLVLAFAQLPLAIWTARIGGFTTDWLYLAAPTTLGCLAALHRLYTGRGGVHRRLVTGFVVLLLCNGIGIAYGPLVYSLVRPDPFSRPAAHLFTPWLTFAFAEWGPRTFTHHMILRSPSPVRFFPPNAEPTFGDSAPFEFGQWDLQYQSPDGDLADWDLECDWLWLPGRETGQDRSQGVDQWAFVFAGYDGARPLHKARPESARFHVVRLVHTTSPTTSHLMDVPAEHPALDEACLGEAVQIVQQRFVPTTGTVRVVDDTERFFFEEVWDSSYRDTRLWQRPMAWYRPTNRPMDGPSYLNLVLLVDRGEDAPVVRAGVWP